MSYLRCGEELPEFNQTLRHNSRALKATHRKKGHLDVQTDDHDYN